MSLPHSAKGYRYLRVGEKIETGDFAPEGPTWEPVQNSLIGTEVMGPRWSGGGEMQIVCRPRKRRMSKAQEDRMRARMASETMESAALQPAADGAADGAK